MKKFLQLLTRSAGVALAVALSSLVILPRTNAATAAGDNELGQPAGTIAVPAGIAKSVVRDTIVAALTGRQWGVQSQTDDRVVGYLKHRTNEATVTFIYSESRIEIYCVGWQIDKKTGAREKPEQPKGWLNNLRSDITKLFNKAATSK